MNRSGTLCANWSQLVQKMIKVNPRPAQQSRRGNDWETPTGAAIQTPYPTLGKTAVPTSALFDGLCPYAVDGAV